MHAALRRLAWLVIVLGLNGLACNLDPAPVTPPTPAPQPVFCRDIVELDRPPRPADPVLYERAIIDYLSGGGAPTGLEGVLRDWGAITDQVGTVRATTDLTQDGYLDVVATFQTGPEGSPPAPGWLLVLACDRSGPAPTFRVAYGQATTPGADTGIPQVILLGDMTGDGQPELAFFVEHCPALACFREPAILTWDAGSGAFRSLTGSFEQYYHYRDPYGEIIRGFPLAGFEIADRTGDGPQEFTVIEGYLSQREAGPHRPATYIFAWNGSEYANPVVLYEPSLYLIHALRDADRMLTGGDLPEAIRLYTAALHDGEPVQAEPNGENPAAEATSPALSPWGGLIPTEETLQAEENTLNAYARYRLVLAYTADGAAEQARQTLRALQAELPWRLDDLPSYFTRLAEVFLSTYQSAPAGVDPLNMACLQVKAYAGRDLRPAYDYLSDPSYFGPALGDYTLDDLCPF